MDRARTPYAWPTPPSITVSHSVIKYPLRNMISLNLHQCLERETRTTCGSVAAALVPVRADPAQLEAVLSSSFRAIPLPYISLIRWWSGFLQIWSRLVIALAF
jgi:hypothetical protein